MMELLSKLERKVLDWGKNIPHLPEGGRKWLGDNIWWIVVIGVVLTGIGLLALVLGLFSLLSTLANPIIVYYASSTFVAWTIVKTVVSLIFAAIGLALMAFAITPLKEKQKKGWVLLFAAWLVGILSVVVSAVLTLSVVNFITSLLFGAIGIAIGGYLLLEMHGQFAHTEHSKGVKSKKSK